MPRTTALSSFNDFNLAATATSSFPPKKNKRVDALGNADSSARLIISRSSSSHSVASRPPATQTYLKTASCISSTRASSSVGSSTSARAIARAIDAARESRVEIFLAISRIAFTRVSSTFACIDSVAYDGDVVASSAATERSTSSSLTSSFSSMTSYPTRTCARSRNVARTGGTPTPRSRTRRIVSLSAAEDADASAIAPVR
mmetsp:Transcript_10202/g.36954  ORF Transcript_10202/g.36954 Transcript_10202/m.36954 type:complete len:202 (-) Transcript_10202:191-796(-)|eukprot:31440-Pelagococcus_subviridis.AAC.17